MIQFAEDEEIGVALASAAGVVIENARLWEQDEYERRWLLSCRKLELMDRLCEQMETWGDSACRRVARLCDTLEANFSIPNDTVSSMLNP